MKNIYPFLLLVCLLASCNHALYTPPVQNVMIPFGKGEKNITATIGTKGFNLNLGAAPTKHLLILAGVRAAQSQDRYWEFPSVPAFPGPPKTIIDHHHISAELGLGYYGNWGPKNHGGWNISAGYGWGKTLEKTTEGGLYDNVSIRYHRLFIQPAFGLRTRYWDAIFSCQVGWNYLGNIEAENPDFYSLSRQFPTIEPAFTLSVGKELRIFLQVSPMISNRVYKRLNQINEIAMQDTRTNGLALGIKGLIYPVHK